MGIIALFLFGLLQMVLKISANWQKVMADRVKAAILKRKNVKDNFRVINGYSWDYVMVFKVYLHDQKLGELQQDYSLKSVLSALSDGGLETRLFYSCQVNNQQQRNGYLKPVVVLLFVFVGCV